MTGTSAPRDGVDEQAERDVDLDAPRGRPARVADRWVAIALAAAAYLPMLLTEPGRVSADTKSYLTIDPAALLARASSMWDPSVGAGTVPHQNIGYLFPLGPYYWTMETLGVPDWVAQRVLWGTIVFAAAYGTYRLLRWLGWLPVVAAVAAVAYGFSPYVLSYLARLSVILGPWAALPWMVLLVALAARTRSWRPAAWFALVVALVGSVNATSLVLAGLAPVIWLVVEVIAGRVSTRAAVAAAARIGTLSLAVSAWWIVALRVQSAYGIPILRYTETYESVASASTPAEVMRGLGYWLLYGGDRLDPWVEPAVAYSDQPALIAFGFAIAGIALLGFLLPFRGRAAAAGLLLVGLAISVGAAPLGDSTPYGALFGWFASDTTAGLALRSTTRAAPLVVFALALGFASSTAWIADRVAGSDHVGARRRRAVAGVAIALLAVQMFPWFTASALSSSLLRDEELPAYQHELADWLDSTRRPDSSGRVWDLPAADFAHYRWGGTIDPALPGILDRPYVARELVLQGGAGTVDLLNAFERRLPEGWFEPETLAPIARRLGVDTVVTRNDLEYERFRLARPGPLWTDVTGQLGRPEHAGPVVEDETVIPWVDQRTMARPDAATRFPAVAAFDLPAVPIASAASTADPIVLAGTGDGLVDLAGAGLLPDDRVVLYAATLDDAAAAGHPAEDALGENTWWVVTDSHRKQGRHWSTVSANLGALEARGELQLDDDPANQPLDVFEPDPDGEDTDRQTIGVHVAEVADVRASYFGNRIAYTLGDAPWFAVDGDPATAWRAGVFDVVDDLVLEIDLTDRVETSTITLLQPLTGVTTRFVTELRVVLDAGTDRETSIDVELDDRSRTLPGQPIELGVSGFTSVRLEVLADNVGDVADPTTLPGVGFAEVTIPGVADDRVVRLPSLDAFDVPARPETQRTTFLLTRQRIDPATFNEADAEPALVRLVEVPADRTYGVTGEVRLAGNASDEVLAGVLDDPIEAIADRRLLGSPSARGASAVDGDTSTAWQTPFDDVVGASVTVTHPAGGVDTDVLGLSYRADERHSVPTRLRVVSDDGTSVDVDVPPADPVDGLVDVELPLPGHRASRSTVTIADIDPTTTPEYFSGQPQTLPVGIAELRFGPDDNRPVAADTLLDPSCRTDLLTVDGTGFPVRIDGTRGAALARGELRLTGCEPLPADAGPLRIDAASGLDTGLDVDRLVLDTGAADGTTGSPPPEVQVTELDDTRLVASVAPSDRPSWFVFRQSWNAGWTATVDGVDLGRPLLVDGFANGWIVPAGAGERRVVVEWTPQRTVELALWFSALAGVGVLGLLVATRRGWERPTATAPPGRPVDRRSPTLAAILLAAVAVFAGPLVAVFAGAVAVLAPRHRWLPAAVIVLAGGVAAGAVTVLEWRFDYPLGTDWPSRFGWTSPWVWVAVGTAVVVAVVPDGVRRTR